jgi:hypothetical protein
VVLTLAWRSLVKSLQFLRLCVCFLAAVGVELIEYRVVRQGRGCVHIEGVSGGVVRTAAALVALHLKNQLELAESLERAKRAEEDLEAAEEEFSLGLRCEFPIDPEVMGLAIGKNGANIQRALETGNSCLFWLAVVGWVSSRTRAWQLTVEIALMSILWLTRHRRRTSCR